MKSSVARCRVCDRRMSLRALASMESELHGLHVQIEGLPVLECPKGHRRFVAPDFADKLIQALVEGDRLVPFKPASRRGRARQCYGCPKCGNDLGDDATSYVEARRVLELNGRHAFGVSVEVPKFQCSTCGWESVPPDEVVLADLLQASAHALRSVRVSRM